MTWKNQYEKIGIMKRTVNEYIDGKMIAYVESHPKAIPVALLANGILSLGSSAYLFMKKEKDISTYVPAFGNAAIGVSSISLGVYYFNELKKVKEE